MSSRITVKLRPDGEGTQREDDSPQSPISSQRQETARESTDDEAVEIFGECLQTFFACGKSAKEIAWVLGLSESHLSEMRAGKRSVTMARLLRMCQRSQEAAMVLGRRLAAAAGLEGPRRKRKVSKRDAQRQLSLELRAMGVVYEIARARAAARLGTEESDIDDALDETTDVRRFDRSEG